MIHTDGSFELTGVTHLVRPVGEEAHDLEELRGALERVPERSLFHHTAGRMLRHPAAAELPPDDLSGWVAGVVQDRETAERMAYAVESQAASMGELRAALLSRLAAVPEKLRVAHDAPPGGEFVFLTVESVRVPTGWRSANAEDIVEQLSLADPGVWFHHLIEEPLFESADRTLAGWLRRNGEARLAELLAGCAHSGRPLADFRRRMLRRWRMRGLGERVAEAAYSTESERLEAGRAVVSRLARRIRGRGEPR